MIEFAKPVESLRFIGVDPGCSGALVMLDRRLEPVEWLLMPTVKNGKSNQVNGAAFSRWLDLADHAYVFVESVHSMPKQGVASSFNFGHSAGVIAGVLACRCFPVEFVTPQAWKKSNGLLGTDKDAARSRAIQIWPNWRDLDKKGQGQAFADAALIARYGALKRYGNEA